MKMSKSMKNLFKIFILISVLILIYTIYKSEIHWSGKNREYYSKFYLISFISITFFSLSFFLNKIFQKYIIITILSIVTSIYMFEFYINYKINFKNQNLDNTFDQRSKLEIYNDLKKTNKNLQITIAPMEVLRKNELNELFPLSGISNVKTIHCNENGYFSIYDSDRYGFNNPDYEWDAKKIEYLLVGDSYTHGSCVNRPDDIASNLRNLSGQSVLNLGYSANGPLIEYAVLREYLSPNVKKILWLYYEGNDSIDLNLELKSEQLLKYYENLNYFQDLKNKQSEINQLLISLVQKRKDRKEYIKILEFIKLYETRKLFKISFSKPKKLPQEFKTIISLANELAIENNAKLYFIYLPSFFRYSNISKFDKTEVMNIINNLNIPFIDIDTEVFKKENNPLKLFPYEKNGHYNPQGYKKIALKIYEKTN